MVRTHAGAIAIYCTAIKLSKLAVEITPYYFPECDAGEKAVVFHYPILFPRVWRSANPVTQLRTPQKILYNDQNYRNDQNDRNDR